MENLFFLYAEVTNQAIFNEYQHHLTDNSLHFMNEARRGKNEEERKNFKWGIGEADSEILILGKVVWASKILPKPCYLIQFFSKFILLC